MPDRGSVVGRAVYHPWGGTYSERLLDFTARGYLPIPGPQPDLPPGRRAWAPRAEFRARNVKRTVATLHTLSTVATATIQTATPTQTFALDTYASSQPLFLYRERERASALSRERERASALSNRYGQRVAQVGRSRHDGCGGLDSGRGGGHGGGRSGGRGSGRGSGRRSEHGDGRVQVKYWAPVMPSIPLMYGTPFMELTLIVCSLPSLPVQLFVPPLPPLHHTMPPSSLICTLAHCIRSPFKL